MYIVLVNENYIRDAQVYVGKEYDNPEDRKSWECFSPRHFVGLFKASNQHEALIKASEKSGWAQEILEVIEMN